MKYLLVLLITSLCACNNVKEKAKETVNKTGEVVATAGAEFAEGVTKGVKKTFSNKVQLSDALRRDGLTIGKTIVNSSDSASDNQVSVYFIFGKDTDRRVTMKVLDETGAEYGRVNQQIKGKANEAMFVDFRFGKRTNIDSKGSIVIE